MTILDIFYQCEGVREVLHIEAPAECSIGEAKALVVARHGLGVDVLVFLEDTDEPLDESLPARTHTGPAGVKLHVHRCRHISVTVRFNNETVEHRFGPGTSVAHVKRWDAEKKFRMSHEEASEHVLQIAGTHDRPAPSTHLGTLAKCPECRVAFDLVPDQRVNGAALADAG